jgi:hypothetical protein
MLREVVEAAEADLAGVAEMAGARAVELLGDFGHRLGSNGAWSTR